MFLLADFEKEQMHFFSDRVLTYCLHIQTIKLNSYSKMEFGIDTGVSEVLRCASKLTIRINRTTKCH